MISLCQSRSAPPLPSNRLIHRIPAADQQHRVTSATVAWCTTPAAPAATIAIPTTRRSVRVQTVLTI